MDSQEWEARECSPACDLAKPTDLEICKRAWASVSGGNADACRQTSIKWCQGWFPANLLSAREDFPKPSAGSFFLGGLFVCFPLLTPKSTCWSHLNWWKCLLTYVNGREKFVICYDFSALDFNQHCSLHGWPVMRLTRAWYFCLVSSGPHLSREKTLAFLTISDTAFKRKISKQVQ